MSERKRVLIVDDNPEETRLLTELLTEYTDPANITVAESIAQLIAQAKSVLPQSVPDITLFGNIYLLGQTGVDVLMADIGGNPLYKQTEPVLISVTANEERTRTTYAQPPFNVKYFIQKPIDVTTFHQTIAPIFEPQKEK